MKHWIFDVIIAAGLLILASVAFLIAMIETCRFMGVMPQ